MKPESASPARPDLDDILRDEDWRHRLRIQRGPAGDFFRAWNGDACVLQERRNWLDTHPERHAPWMSEASPLAGATAGFLQRLEAPSKPGVVRSATHDEWRDVAARHAPDLVLLRRSPGGARMVAGAVCFPSSWRPEEKLGRTLAEIHDVVPGLQDQIGPSIDVFLDRLVPGPAWFRVNWGLTACDEGNQHPDRGLPRLCEGAVLASTFLRIEYQCLVALPGLAGMDDTRGDPLHPETDDSAGECESRRTSPATDAQRVETGDADSGAMGRDISSSPGILFGIRIEHVRLDQLRDTRPGAARGLARQLRSMPEAMARYKGLGEIGPRLAEQLG